MASLDDILYAIQLSQINGQIPTYYGYCVPWMAIGCNLFALGVLFFRKRQEREQNLVILIFKWQYATGLIYALNMLLNDNVFSLSLFNFILTRNVSDLVCKLHLILLKYFYSMSPWMQVVITFDRLWSIIFANKLKIKRTLKTVTILILGLQTLVFLVNLFYLTYYLRVSTSAQSVFDPALNKNVYTNVTVSQCVITSTDIQTAQDLLHVIMRIVLPLLIMIVCSVVLVRHIREAKKKVISGRNQKRELHFTVAVALINGAFFAFNAPITIYYIIYYYIRFSGVTLSFLGNFQFTLFFTVAYLFSYMFTLCQFWVDLALNRLFRGEILAVFSALFRQNRVATDNTNENKSTTTAK